MATRVTISAVNAALAKAGVDAKLVSGDGCFYFTGPEMDLVKERGVYGVFHLDDLTVEQWVAKAKSKLMPTSQGVSKMNDRFVIVCLAIVAIVWIIADAYKEASPTRIEVAKVQAKAELDAAALRNASLGCQVPSN